ncbi:MFS transporter [Sphaerisporangium perillae]|uniref:MFS transporter n=1 Tax=Sphaerisporangium perillae TaxID=2935860 RepID=UPI00200C9AB2|nr:MFS transporter [Sphaerisporangium perillae]
MTGSWRRLRSFNGRVQLLLLNQFTIKLSFNLLMPYLAGHLTRGLGYAAWAVGLVLSVRNTSQRGLCLVGGHLADRLGYRQAIVAGCALRTAGFALLGVVCSLPALLAASVLTGFAGALFEPGVRAYLAAEAGDRRAEAFGLFNVAGQVGLLLGPPAGLALVSVNFQAVSIAAAALFAVITLVQARALPARAPVAREPGEGWRPVLRDRRFLAFSVVMTTFYVLSFQLYLALPLVMRQAVGEEQDAGMGQMFALSAIVVIAGQRRVTAWVSRRWSPTRSLTIGLAVAGAAFLPLVIISDPVPVRVGPEELGEILGIAPILLTAVLLALSTMLICPFEMDVIVGLARGRLVATHYGLYATISGLVVTLGGLLTGSLWDFAAGHGIHWLPWTAMTLVGCCGALGLAALERAGRLLPRPPAGEGERRANRGLRER